MPSLSRTTIYCGISTLLTTVVVVNAFEARPNFFAAAMYLSQSSACLMILTNMFLVCTLLSGKLLQNIFFGRLRAIEVDHLYERAWYAITETCLAMTIFREEFDTRFFLFFTLLLAVKIFHWLAQDRIEYMEQTVEVARTFHLRMTSIIVLLFSVDIWLVIHCLGKVFAHGPNVMVMFAFEFTILASTILSVAGKYVLNLIEARQPETWDNKSVYIFYMELLTDFIKLITYVAFFATIMTFYGIPLHIVRDLYVTLRSFTTKCRNFMRFRKATQDMDARYPNATVAEIDATGDKTCIVCREDMTHESTPQVEGEPIRTALDNPKRLPCGHILHFRCLRSWLERQQSCPMCRRPVLDEGTPSTVRNMPVQNAGIAPRAGQANDPHRQVGRMLGDDTTGPQNIQSSQAQFQLPAGQRIEPIQLPRGFRLPPGWALLPVTTPEAPTPSSSATQTTQRVPLQSVHQAPNVNNSNGNPQNIRLPPVIPLFSQGPVHAESTRTTPAPELSDEQLASMEQSTRAAVENRMRVLSTLQSRISEDLAILARLDSVSIPSVPQPGPIPASTDSTGVTEQPSPTLPHEEHRPASPGTNTTEALTTTED